MKCNNIPTAIRVIFGVGAAIMLALPAASQERPAPDYTLASHRAVYDLSLDQTGAGSNVTDITGELVYDFKGSRCEGYTLNTRLVTQIFDREGKPSTTDIRSETWEDAEGKRFRFTTSQYADGKLSENTKGVARRMPRGEGLLVELEKPRRETISLPGRILFPTQHSITVLKAALSGQERLQANLYDGSEKGTKVYETTTVIGSALSLAANEQLPTVKNAQELDKLRSWPVLVSYYDRGPKKDELPTYEVSFRMYENGVSRKLKLDYGTFSLNGRLSAIEFLEAKPCR